MFAWAKTSCGFGLGLLGALLLAGALHGQSVEDFKVNARVKLIVYNEVDEGDNQLNYDVVEYQYDKQGSKTGSSFYLAGKMVGQQTWTDYPAQHCQVYITKANEKITKVEFHTQKPKAFDIEKFADLIQQIENYEVWVFDNKNHIVDWTHCKTKDRLVWEQVVFTYDTSGFLAKRRYIGAGGHTTTMERDKQGYLTALRDFEIWKYDDKFEEHTTYEYSVMLKYSGDRLVEADSTRGRKFQFVYDGSHLVTCLVTVPGQFTETRKPLMTYTYE